MAAVQDVSREHHELLTTCARIVNGYRTGRVNPRVYYYVTMPDKHVNFLWVWNNLWEQYHSYREYNYLDLSDVKKLVSGISSTDLQMCLLDREIVFRDCVKSLYLAVLESATGYDYILAR